MTVEMPVGGGAVTPPQPQATGGWWIEPEG
jgi:hypothetical protein